MEEELDIKPYKGKYPSAAQVLIEAGVVLPPRQNYRDLTWASGIDIVYQLRGMTPPNFRASADSLLMLALQEGERYKEAQYKFARFEVVLSKKASGSRMPENLTFQASMHHDTSSMVFGPGYEVPTHDTLSDKVNDILDITNRYPGKLDVQRPYRVYRLVISIRTRKLTPLWAAKTQEEKETYMNFEQTFKKNRVR